MKSENLTAVVVVAAAAGAFYVLQRRKKSAAAGAAPAPYFTSPAVASGVQSGQNLATAAGALLRGGLGVLRGIAPNRTPINTNQASAPATTTGDFARLDRAVSIDDAAFNPPNNVDAFGAMNTQDTSGAGGMASDLASWWG